ncbi:hypothetical protein BFS30_22240 [Pedobacter steynii]|uniref:Uncharacterized protein n=1 Tax=Pedobacter steynii TaxID=430522 RepID=A0A1D7QLT7_9SPHI|nr:hypothetical protein BFS30_22240 [Pedobacter steynii]
MNQKRCSIHQDKPVISRKLIRLRTIRSQMLWSMFPAVSSAKRNKTGEKVHIDSKIENIAMGSAHLKGLNLNKGVPANSLESDNLIVFITKSFI